VVEPEKPAAEPEELRDTILKEFEEATKTPTEAEPAKPAEPQAKDDSEPVDEDDSDVSDVTPDLDVTPPAKDPFDPELLRIAKQLGFDEARARSFGTPENLVDLLRLKLSAAQATPGAEPAAKPAETVVEKAKSILAAVEIPNIDEAEYGPEIVKLGKVVSTMYEALGQVVKNNDELTAQLNTAREEYKPALAMAKEQHSQRLLDDADKGFAALGEAYEGFVARASY